MLEMDVRDDKTGLLLNRFRTKIEYNGVRQSISKSHLDQPRFHTMNRLTRFLFQTIFEK